MSERIVIKEICEVYDGPHATPKKTVDGPVYLGIDAITDDGKINAKEFAHLSEEDYIKWTKRVTPQYGDIVFSYEATLGRYALIPKDFYGCLGRRLAIIRNVSKDIDTLWLYYYFLSPEWKQFIQSKIIKGSTVNRISVEDFPTYTVPNISIKVQRKIANILSKIDEKIALNNNINDNLEQQAKLIYDYWFTQFDFPDENGKPYCSSGGKMVWNEQLKRNIPENWKVAQLKDIFNVSGKPISRDDCQTDAYYTPIDVIPKRTITFAGGLSAAEANSSLQLYEENNILLGAMRVYFHRVCISAQSGITRTTTLVLKPKADEYLGYAYQVLNDDNAILYATQHSSGTQQPYIKWNDVLENYRFAMPSNPKSLYEYSKISEPLITKAKNCARETEQLRKLRDWLLPMLMNGQATISD